MKVVLVAGGTGGHVYPAIALGEYLRDKKECELLFFGVNGKMEANEVPKHNLKFIGLDASGFVGSLANRVKCLYLVAKNIGIAKRYLKDFKADVVVGFGGYVSVPVILAANSLGIPCYLHEQNSVAGLANRFLGKRVNGVITCFEEAASSFDNKNVKLLGSPRAQVLAENVKDETILKEMNLLNDRPLGMIVMGSLGSESVNKAMLEVLNKLRDDSSLELIYVTGPLHYEEMKASINELPAHLHLVPYVDQERLLPFLDFIVCRSGATTIAEICALGVPAILIPSPYVAHNHQMINANSLIVKDAALMIEENSLTADLMIDTIHSLLSDEEHRKLLAANALKQGHLHACDDIYDFIKVK